MSRATGQWCDTIRTSWLSMGRLTEEEECHECVLKSFVADLNSPFGYDFQYEQDFHEHTSSCNSPGYTFTTPGEYTIPATTTTTTETRPTPSCRVTHTVGPSDSCNSIAHQYSVSTWSIIMLNGLDFRCRRLEKGMQLCIGTQCAIHQVLSGETCDSIVEDSGGSFTDMQLASWNPFLDALCMNIAALPNNVICVG